MLLSLGTRYPEEALTAKHVLMPWLVRHSGWLLSKLQKTYDGRTPYQRATGKEFSLDLYEFGEQVLYRVPEKNVGFKLDPRWLRGVWLGGATPRRRTSC